MLRPGRRRDEVGSRDGSCGVLSTAYVVKVVCGDVYVSWG